MIEEFISNKNNKSRRAKSCIENTMNGMFTSSANTKKKKTFRFYQHI